MRTPRPLYRHGWGWLLGHTFLLITHQGRKTGKRRETVAMALTYDPDTREAVIFSAWGPNTEWMRNLRAHPALQIQIGARDVRPRAALPLRGRGRRGRPRVPATPSLRLRLFATILGWGDLSSEAPCVSSFAAARSSHSGRPKIRRQTRGGDVTRTMTSKAVARAGAAVAVASALYIKLLRQPILTWGATAGEAAHGCPATSCSRAPTASRRARSRSTPRAGGVAVDRADGPAPRGGAYTYDWIENLLGLDMHSVDRVLPEFQHPEIGDGFGFGAEPDAASSASSPSTCSPFAPRTATGSGRSYSSEQRRQDAPDQPQPLPAAEAEGRSG